jgi:autotransporter-associated beta strand protein
MVFTGGIDLTTAGSSSGRTLTFAGAGNVTVSGVIANGGNGTGASTNAAVTFSSTGVNLLSGNNTYGGVTTIATNSTLKIGSAGALGATNGNTVVSSGGVLDLNSQTISGEPLSLSGSGISTGGALINSGDTDASWSGTVALVNAATYISASAGKKITLSGVVSGDAKGIYKKGTGTLELSGANTFTGAAEVADGTMILSAPNSATSYKVQGYETNIFPVLKVSATNAMSSSANVVGSSSVTKTGTLEFTTNGNYTLNQYNQGNISFTNSSVSPTTLTFTNLTNYFTTAAGRTLANKSTNLTITFNGQMDIGGSTNDVCKIEAFGPVVIMDSVFNSSNSVVRGLEKSDGAATLTMYGVNNYNGTTTVSKGTLSIPAGGSLANCGNTIVKGVGSSAGNSANLNLAGAAGVVQVSTNGFVRGGGSITSLEVQDAGAVEVAVGTTWTTGGTIDFAAGSKVLVTGTPTEASYTLVTASGGITGTPALQTPIDGYSLVIEGDSLVLKQTSTSDTTPPVITVVGADPVTVAQGSVYSDEGATTDDGSAVTPNIPPSITSTVGSKTVTYDSVDASGNNATQRTRTVIVTDQTVPVLVLNGANPLSVNWGGVFTDPGASFTDNVDASKTVYSLDTVDTSRLGSTTLTYSAVDAGGNAAVNVTRAVTVTLADGGTTVGADGLSDLMRYALGGTGPSSKVELPTVAVTSTTLTMNALIRIDDLKVSVVGIYGLAPGTWVTGSPITGVPSSSQSGAVAGVTQRQDFSVPRGTDSKKFMYLKATQTP